MVNTVRGTMAGSGADRGFFGSEPTWNRPLTDLERTRCITFEPLSALGWRLF